MSRKRCKHRPLYRALNKYGIDNFSIETVEECPDPQLLSEREIFWISYYHSFHYGYNATKGGDGSPYLDEEKIIACYNKQKNLKKTSEILHVSTDGVKAVLKRNNIHIFSQDEVSRNKMLPVLMFSLDGVFLKEFPTVFDAADYLSENGFTTVKDKEKLKGIAAHIRHVCRGVRKSASGFLWEYKR